jgi:hypothetical protein
MSREDIVRLRVHGVIFDDIVVGGSFLLRDLEILNFGEGDRLIIFLSAGENSNLLLLEVLVVLLVGYLTCDFETRFESLHA